MCRRFASRYFSLVKSNAGVLASCSLVRLVLNRAALSGTHLWADRFDGLLEDVFDLQDRVAVSVAGVIEPTLQYAEIRRSAERPTTDLTAYDVYLRALSHWGSYEKEHVVQALDLLGQAIKRDSHYGPALALAAHSHQLLAANGWADDQETNRRKSIDLARRALRFAPDDPDVLAFGGFALGYFDEDTARASDRARFTLRPRPRLGCPQL